MSRSTSVPISNREILSVNFNQDNSCISTGTKKGYTITNCDPFGKVYGKNDGPTLIVEMLFCTSLVALVGAGDRANSSSRRLQIVNTKRQSTICELSFQTTILAVKLNRRRLVVVLEERIYIYDISNMKLLHELETGPNPHAVCALSPSSENSYLAYPPPPSTTTSLPSISSGASSAASTSSVTGDVLVFDTVSLSNVNMVHAHKTPLAVVAINPTGTLIATASEKGTVIRVFTIPGGERLHEFRRGSYPAKIHSISFNAVSTLLCVSSDTETVHIFKLAKGGVDKGANGRSIRGSSAADFQEDSVGRYNTRDATDGQVGGYEAFIDGKKNDGGMSGSIRRKSVRLGRDLAGSVGGFLPGSMTGMWDPQRDFAYLKLPTAGVKSVVALSSTTPQVMVITSEGLFYSYAIDLENGGECVLQKSYSLLDLSPDDANGGQMGD